LSDLPLLSGYDETETLSYQTAQFGPIGADVRQSTVRPLKGMQCNTLKPVRGNAAGFFNLEIAFRSDCNPDWATCATIFRSDSGNWTLMGGRFPWNC